MSCDLAYAIRLAVEGGGQVRPSWSLSARAASRCSTVSRRWHLLRMLVEPALHHIEDVLMLPACDPEGHGR
jgi:hypothetical protein